MAKGESRKAQKNGRQKGKRKRTALPESGRTRWEKDLDERRVSKLERLLDELDEAVRKAKPLMSEEEALRELHELRRQRAAHLLGR